MAVLVTGPTSSGKSTFIDRILCAPEAVTKFGYQIGSSGIGDDDVVHYNLLHPSSVRLDLTGVEPDFLDERIFNTIIESGRISHCHVIVASIDSLLSRASTRTHVERSLNAVYNSELWLNRLQEINLFGVYEALFDILKKKEIPYDVHFSAQAQEPIFLRSDRVFVHANLAGRYIVPPAENVVKSILDDPFCHYQEVELPGGHVTSTRGYDHLAGRAKFASILPPNCLDQSFLDIGSALGQLLFTAMRFGAKRLMGIEKNEGRILAARKLGAVLGSDACFIRADFTDLELGETFDHVYALNVIHHVYNYRDFLAKAAKATAKTLTVEFPVLDDPIFGATIAGGQEALRRLNEFPLIGVSTRGADQSYVFTPNAVIRLLVDDLGAFSQVEHIQATIKGRSALRFAR